MDNVSFEAVPGKVLGLFGPNGSGNRPCCVCWPGSAEPRPGLSTLERVGMAERRDRYWQSLSGGERQRVYFARALAQSPTEMLLDEPTNHLDVQHHIELLRLISQLALTSIVALHDLNHAAMFCDRLLVMDQGRIVASDRPKRC